MRLFQDMSEVQKEYQECFCPSVVSSMEEACVLLGFYLNETEEFSIMGEKEIRKDKIEYMKASVLNIAKDFIFGITNPMAILGDIEFLEEQIGIANLFGSCFEELLGTITEDNYQEITKLGEFCYSAFLTTEDEMQLSQNVVYYNIDHEIYDEYDSSMISSVFHSLSFFQEFFTEQLNLIKKEESVEIVKKI